MRTVLFICSGNTCRSPMAEAIAQAWMDRELPADGERCLAVSGGMSTAGGAPVSSEAVRTLAGMGLEAAGRSKPVTAEMIAGAEAVFCMTTGHRLAALAMMSQHGKQGDGTEQAAKIRLLDPEGDVDDPFGMSQAVYDAVGRRLAELIPLRLKEVLLHEDRAGLGSSRR